jgi:two-component system sensor histidine kinase/response regulator
LAEESNNSIVKILLVDDRVENLISLESLLYKEGEGITYLTATSGQEALKIALKEELALILLDVQMPDMNGYEVAKFLRNSSKTKNIPIIFVTAIDQDASRMVEGFEAGAVDFLFKPLHPYITKSKVSAFIDFYRQKKELEKAHDYVLQINSELEERVKERTKELIKINNDLDNFIYTASHDLKAPISNIEGLMNTFYDSLSEESKSSEDVSEIRQMIEESIQRFKNTIIDLTEVAKAQSEIASDSSEVDIHEMLCEIKLSIKDLINEMGAQIIEDFSQLPKICFSKKNLRSIIYNLVSNAIKYSSPLRKPIIEISTSIENNFMVLIVKDNGLGIREEDKPKVFAMFKRLHTHVEGTGIGMSIVKKIVENNGGIIELTSEVGVGSEFKIYLKK